MKTLTNLNYLNRVKYLSHMTSFDNLDGIFKYGLQNHYTTHKKVDISNIEVNDRRERKESIYGHKIHEYVPFYFNPRNAMLYKNNKNNNVVILGFSVKTILGKKVLFANKNAATNSVKFTTNLTELLNSEFIDFQDVFASNWCNNGERNELLKAKMMAEILVYNSVDISNLRYIICKDKQMQERVKAKFALKGIQVIIDKSKFF